MPGKVLVGAAWGDEGKGKIVDFYAGNASAVVRYTGGPNAGHTLYHNGKKIVLRLIPSGILHSHTECFLAPGVVIDPFVLESEIASLSDFDLKDRLFISDRAHIITYDHLSLDAKDFKIGTTKKGVGPAYASKINRTGIRVKEFLAEKSESPSLESVKDKIRPFVCSRVSEKINVLLKENRSVLFEGAQGTLLDIDHGTYPYVTSSNAVAGGACTGAGVGPTFINKVGLISKAYITRVGNGPFPSEIHGEVADKLREVGHEYGSVTKRPRRIGWLDLPLLKYAVAVNGATSLILTKLDVLTGLDKLQMVTSYQNPEADLEDAVPVMEEFSGWDQDLTKVQSFSDLSKEVATYLERIEDEVKCPLRLLSVGPNRNDVIWI